MRNWKENWEIGKRPKGENDQSLFDKVRPNQTKGTTAEVFRKVMDPNKNITEVLDFC
jgi:hypothetical protein